MKRTSASCDRWLQVLTAAQVLGRTVRKSFLTGEGQQEVFTGHVLGRRRNWWVSNAALLTTTMCVATRRAETLWVPDAQWQRCTA